ncbi:MAG: acyl-CoA dehydratase activase [Deferribacterota bacterium]|nr:acyl-CoA dehydratase activase [Deferribacterota bacterium]
MNKISAFGIDVGSTTTKIVGVDSSGIMVWNYLEQTEPAIEKQLARFFGIVRENFGDLKDIPIIATGYGRKLVKQTTKVVTEITCHAKGVFKIFGHGGTLLDVGGQDSKVIVINSSGDVVDFTMNDKCAAGTGRFLEYTAGRLGYSVNEIGEIAMKTENEVPITSTCTVFAETEIISMISSGTDIALVLKGLHRSLIKRIIAMIKSVNFIPPLMLSGGVANNVAIREMIEEEMGEKTTLSPYPQFMGAYGAALLGLDNS